MLILVINDNDVQVHDLWNVAYPDAFIFNRKYRARIEQFIISLTEHADKKDFSKSSLEISNKVWWTQSFFFKFLGEQKLSPLL